MFLGKYLETKQIDHHLLLFVHFVYQKNNKGLVMKNGYKWAVLDLYFIRSTTVVHCQLIPLLTMYEDIIRLLLVKVGKYSEHLFNKHQLNLE